MLWALLDLGVQLMGFEFTYDEIDSVLIVSYILAPSLGTFFPITILLALHLSNHFSVKRLLNLRYAKRRQSETNKNR